ncbi:MAG TPA: bifunctional (p)ppGpp synthetase/guanosine-3',5'-bis(diphosphate) 3'-pyrophosphohydrolase [Acidimicrobiia bacterium]|nr:bifunctional (p)ppGpp synthetase/guanosine-3',5'-bis(diphosphate) 3'-pyrophosphohydrolase [Acidimicrobiia bacterium]
MRSFATTDGDPGAAEGAIDAILEAHRRHFPDAGYDLIRRAYLTAEHAHRGQVRKTGDPYITHPVAVTGILAEYGLDAAALAAALLHDTVEDTDITLHQIEGDYGREVAQLIDGVTKLDRIQYSSPQEAQAATIRKMVVAMAQDVRVLLIKLADRLHNLRTVSALRVEKQQRVARETIDVYVPLAHRLGVQEIKHELEDRCFAILEPGIYAEIEDKLAERSPEREVFIEKVIAELESALAESGIDAVITGRPKHQFSIYRKMVESGRPFEEIFDLIGVRIITMDTRNCYAALGMVHSRWVPISGRFKDFIAMPKINLYQSLHTTVIGPGGKPLEVQIRTAEMHRLAESGIAAHWRYKEGPGAAHIPWVGDVHSLLETEDPQEFLANLKLDLYQDEVFVLTPAGDVKTLPRGATAVDFAYAVHTEVGNRCVGARINGRLLPLSTRLESGDIVEVITSRALDAGPSRDWLNFVQTSRAKSKIKAYFLKERREQALGEGREQVASYLRREGLGLGAAERDRLMGEIALDLGKSDLDGLLVAVGDGSLAAATVVQRLVRMVRPEMDEEEDLLAPPRPRRPGQPGPGIIVEGMGDMLVRIARCCAPVPGDQIVGFITVGRGVSVHRSECTNISALTDQRERMVEVSWPPDRVGIFTVWIQVEALDRTRLLRDVTGAISDHGGNITASSSVTGRDRVAILRYEVELSDPGQLPRLLSDVRGVDGVFAAQRLVTEPADG